MGVFCMIWLGVCIHMLYTQNGRQPGGNSLWGGVYDVRQAAEGQSKTCAGRGTTALCLPHGGNASNCMLTVRYTRSMPLTLNVFVAPGGFGVDVMVRRSIGQWGREGGGS